MLGLFAGLAFAWIFGDAFCSVLHLLDRKVWNGQPLAIDARRAIPWNDGKQAMQALAPSLVSDWARLQELFVKARNNKQRVAQIHVEAQTLMTQANAMIKACQE